MGVHDLALGAAAASASSTLSAWRPSPTEAAWNQTRAGRSRFDRDQSSSRSPASGRAHPARISGTRRPRAGASRHPQPKGSPIGPRGGRHGAMLPASIANGRGLHRGSRMLLQLFRQYHVPPATEEVIHCLQSQGSPAAASQRCKLRPRRHFEPGGAAQSGPFFSYPLKSPRPFPQLLARPRAPRYSLSFAFPLLVTYEGLAFCFPGGNGAGAERCRNAAEATVCWLRGPIRLGRLWGCWWVGVPRWYGEIFAARVEFGPDTL